MTIEEFFDNYLSQKINLVKLCDGECKGSEDGCDYCLIMGTYKDLVEKLKEEMKVLATDDEENLPSYFLTGSYRRNTMIRPPKDVDLFLVLDSQEYRGEDLDDLITPVDLIEKLKTALEKIYEGQNNIEVKSQRHSVTVKYTDNFSIDVIPAFETEDETAYKIPDAEEGKEDKYITSNPKTHYEYINKVNDDTEFSGKKRFKKIARLIKYIKRKEFNSEPIKLRSFHLELLAAKILEGEKITSYSDGLHKFFQKAGSLLDKASIIDPANPDNKVDDYIEDWDDWTRETIKGKLQSIHETITNAVEQESNGNIEESLSYWRTIFNEELEDNKQFTQNVYVGHSPPKPWRSF